MPICPKCRQEYDEGIEKCADCLVPLADRVESEGPPPESEGMEVVVFRARDEQTLDLMQRAVAVHHIPFRCSDEFPEAGLKGHLMLVPSLVGEKVARILEHGVRMLIAEGEGKDRVYRIYEPGKEEEIRDPKLLRAPVSLLVQRGEEIIDELIEIVVRGDQAARHRAAYVLSCMREEGTLAIIKLLKVAIEKERQDLAVILIRVIREEVETATGWQEITGYLRASSSSARIISLQAIAAMGSIAAFPEVLPLLSDEDPEVRDEADNTLCILADEDMGFDTNAPETEREAVKRRWHDWWSRRRNG